MDPSLATSPTTSNGGISVRNSKLNIFLWNFIKTLTLCSMLLMVLSIYYSFFASKDESRVVIYAIIIAFTMISYTFIIPNLAEIAAAAIPFVGVNRHLSIRLLILAVWSTGGVKYPFLVHFLCFTQMAGIGLWKLYGDEGPVFTRVLCVIGGDTLQVFLYMYGMLGKNASYGMEWLKSGGAGGASLGLSIMVFIANYLPQVMEPGKKKMINATATMKEMNMVEAAIPAGVRNEDI